MNSLDVKMNCRYFVLEFDRENEIKIRRAQTTVLIRAKNEGEGGSANEHKSEICGEY